MFGISFLGSSLSSTCHRKTIVSSLIGRHGGDGSEPIAAMEIAEETNKRALRLPAKATPYTHTLTHTHTHTHTHTQREKPMAVKRKTDRSRFAASEATLGGTRVALLCCVCVELLAVFVWNRFGTRSATWKATHGRAVLFFGFCRRSLFGPRRPMGRHLVDPLIGC